MKRFLALTISLVLVLTFFAGCGNATSTAEDVSESTISAAQSTSDVAPEPESDVPSVAGEEAPVTAPEASGEEAAEETWQPGMFPIPGETRELSMWTTASNDVLTALEDLNDHICIQACEEATNIHVNFTTIATSAASDSYNLMAAGGDFCDAIKCNPQTMSGGLATAYNEEIIIDLADYIPTYAPNYYACLDEDMIKEVSTDDGQMLAMFNIYENFVLDKGTVIRQDLLDKLGLDVPVTYDEYTNVLKAFKSEFDLTDPYFFQGDDFSGGAGGAGAGLSCGFGINAGFYQVDGKVYYSQVQDAMYDYYQYLRGWYADGIINEDWFSRPGNPLDAANQKVMLEGQAGIYMTSVTDLSSENYTTVEDWSITAIARPVQNAGDKLMVGDYIQKVNSRGFFVTATTACEDPALVCEWTDWWFTDEGMTVANWGIEGETYTVENGQNVYTDLVANNPDMVYSIARGVYCYMAQTPTRNDMLSTNCILNQKGLDALDLWLSNVDGSYELPAALSLTPDESYTISSTMSDIYTYVNETAIRFVIGEIDLNKNTWQEYVDTIEGLNYQNAVTAYESALARYNNR